MGSDMFSEFSLENLEEAISESELLMGIELRVREYMNTDIQLLFSYMYRMDILESDIKHALYKSEDSTALALAKLILKRQKERFITKQKYKQSKSIDGWDEW